MRLIATDVVSACLSVCLCLFVTTMNLAKTAELISMPFGSRLMWFNFKVNLSSFGALGVNSEHKRGTFERVTLGSSRPANQQRSE